MTELPVEPRAPRERPPVGQTFVLEPRFDRPLHPLSTSTWLPIHARTLGSTMRRIGLPIEGMEERVFLGRVYGRMVPMLDRGKDGPPPPDWLLRQLFRFLPPMRRRLAQAQAYESDDAIAAILDRWEEHGREAATESTRTLRQVDLSALSDVGLAGHLDAVLQHVETVAEAHFELSFVGVYIPTGRLGLLSEELLGWSPFDTITLVQGYGEASTAHGRAIARLLSRLRPEVVAAALTDPAVLADEPAVGEYLLDHGHRVNVDLAQPTEAEDVRLVAEHLRRHAAVTAGRGDPRVAAHEAERRALDALAGAGDRARFQAALALARRGRPYGDETEAATLDALTLVRFVALEAARRLARDGRLEREADVWFMRLPELRACLRSAEMCVPDLAARRDEHGWALANPAPLHLGPPPAPPPSISVIPARYRSTIGAILWATAEAPAPTSAPETHGDRLLRGEAGSPGRAVGTVRVVRDMAEFGRVEPGDIVVCPTTAAAWSPVFGVMAGIVTEHGGLLSHPAILAREYGLPAVLGVTHATGRLPDGVRVEIDGGQGTVTVI